MAGKKMNTKQLSTQRKKRRQWITTMRMVRYGVNNFSRNAWLTIAATAVMTITLLIVFMSLTARSTLITTLDDISSKVEMSIYIQNGTEQADVNEILSDVRELPNVSGANYLSPEQVRSDSADRYSDDPGYLEALNTAENRFSGVIRVSLADINDTTQLDEFVKTNEGLQEHIDPDREPSFAGERRAAIQNIARWVDFADRAGLAATAVFVVISSLIVFNTIRMAIFNRKEEIQMMKLIGADRSFIRGPFIVEAVVYGFIAAIIATGLGVSALISTREKLMEYQIAIGPTIDFIISYIGFVLLGMILLGATIGIISSLLATRRYLRL